MGFNALRYDERSKMNANPYGTLFDKEKIVCFALS